MKQVIELLKVLRAEEEPYVQTYTVIAGGKACNARCLFCVSKMTPSAGVGMKMPNVDWRNFHKGADLALMWGAATFLITSKGESTLFPEQITQFLLNAQGKFPMVELQTNGIEFIKGTFDYHLKTWYDLGLNTIAISVAHFEDEYNHRIYLLHKESYINLIELIDKLHQMKFSVRLGCMLVKDYIDTPKKVKQLLEFSAENNVEQLTVRPIETPDKSENSEIADWTRNHTLSKSQRKAIKRFFENNAVALRELVHGAVIYDYKGQNCCLGNCLTIAPKSSAIRQLIFFPDGHVRYDWQHKEQSCFKKEE